MASAHSPGIFAITKPRLFLVVSLALTWWCASLLPQYKPYIQAEFRSRLDEARQKIPSIKVDWHTPSDDPRDAYNTSKVALIIEPRVVPHLVPQILHMMAVVPPDWRFLFIGSNKSVLSVAKAHATKNQQVIGKLDLMVLPEPWRIDAKEHVYRTLTDKRFYDEFLPGVEWLLKFESDSILCANSDKSLNDWLDWHWAGAPRTPDDRFSGNGGLSVRRISAIKRVLGFQARYNDTEPEDEWFGKRLYILPGAKVASGTDGVLTVEDLYVENAMGFHVRDGGRNLADAVWKNPNQRRDILDYCPELSMIMEMKLERERCQGDDKKGLIHPTQEEQAEERRKQQVERQRQEAEENARKKAEDDAKVEAAKKAKEEAKAEADKKAEEAAKSQLAAEAAQVTQAPGPEAAAASSDQVARTTTVNHSTMADGTEVVEEVHVVVKPHPNPGSK